MVANLVSVVKEIDSIEVNIRLKTNNIVYVFIKDNCTIDVDLQTKLLESYDQITEGKLMPFIFFAGDNVTLTKEARDNAILIEHQSMVAATAVVITNLAYKIMANFYMQFNKPKRPYKIFSNELDAIDWLNTIIINNEE